MKVKPYAAYREGILVYPDSAEQHYARTRIEKGVCKAPFCDSPIVVKPIFDENIVTYKYLESFFDASLNMEINHDVEAFMVYVELPKYSGTLPALSLLSVILQHGKVRRGVALEGSPYYFYDLEGDGVWEKGRISQKSELNELRSGFKGYIKFYIKDFVGYGKGYPEVDMSEPYNLAAIQFGYNYIGKDYESLLIGGYFAILEDCDMNFVPQKSEEADTITIKLEPSTAEKDRDITIKNPDRGFRMKVFIDLEEEDDEKLVYPIKKYPPMFKAECDKTNPNVWIDPNVVKTYFFLTKWNREPVLPDYVFERIQKVMDYVEEIGQTAIIRFVYQSDIRDPSLQAPHEVMFAHMQQLKPVLERNKHRINIFEAGFFGAYAEWHGYYPGYYSPTTNSTRNRPDINKIWANSPYDEALIIKNILDNVPEDLYVLFRYYSIIDKFLAVYPDEKYKKRMGLKNDAFFGTVESNQFGIFWPHKSLTNIDSVGASRTSIHTPMSGEFLWGAEWFDRTSPLEEPYPRVTADHAILGFKYYHQNTFALWHNSWEGKESIAKGQWHRTDREGDIEIWAKTELDEQWLKDNYVFYSPKWFIDKDGNRVAKTQFEFVRDHLGYKLEARELKITGKIQKGANLDLQMKLVNYGFSAAFNMTSEFVILDKDNNIVSRVKAGEPDKWVNSSALEMQKACGKIDLPNESGDYKLAFYLHNRAGTGAYIGNDIEWAGEYNILYNFTI